MKWNVWQLADDEGAYGDDAGKEIIVSEDGEAEITGIVYDIHNEGHAQLIAAAPDMFAALVNVRDFLKGNGYDLRIVDAALDKAKA